MKMLRVVSSAIVGNALEFYDMLIYSFFASTIAEHFFPKQDKLAGIASVFGIFFISYLARPLSAVFFGRMGDQLRRKPALVVSIWLMALSTCGIVLIPDYDTIGCPTLLLLNLLILQGLSCGGEVTGSIIFIVEHAFRTKRGFYGSFGKVGFVLGLLLPLLAAWLINASFSQAQIVSLAWRLPFLLAALGGVIGWLVRRKVPETELFLETYQLPQNYFNTRRDYLKQLRPAVMIMGLELFASVLALSTICFLVTYMNSILHYTRQQALSIEIISVILLVLL